MNNIRIINFCKKITSDCLVALKLKQIYTKFSIPIKNLTNGFLVEAKKLIKYKSNILEEKEAINIELNERISDSKNVIDLDCLM